MQAYRLLLYFPLFTLYFLNTILGRVSKSKNVIKEKFYIQCITEPIQLYRLLLYFPLFTLYFLNTNIRESFQK